MELSDLRSRITDLQLKIDQLKGSCQDPRDILMAALEDLSIALEELDVAQEEICQQDESLQSAYLTIEAQRQNYLELFNFAPDCRLVTDLNGVIKEANMAASALLKSSLIGQSLDAFLESDSIAGWQANLSHLKSGGDLREWEARVRPSCGRAVPVTVSANATRDPKGNPNGLRWQLHDLTRRRKAEKALQEKEEFICSVLSSLKEHISVLDRDGKITAVNSAWESFAAENGGHTPSIGQNYLEVCRRAIGGESSEEAPLALAGIQGVLDGTRKEFSLEYPCHSPEKKRWFFMNAMPLKGSLGGAVVSHITITERKQAEEIRERLVKELESKNSEMERFIYTVSHDLRSPLVTINGFVGFLKSDLAKGSSERVDTDIKMISMAITKMESLLKDTLELSRIGRVASPPRVVRFADIAMDAADQVSEKIRARGVRLEIEPDLPMVNVDLMRVVEVLTNLIENSVKYMGDQPHPVIKIGCRIDKDCKVFFVKDNGMGIDKSQYDKVFGLFYKVNKKSEGSGAGLAIVKRIIEVHDGRIWIESGLGHGCTICFTLPEAI